MGRPKLRTDSLRADMCSVALELLDAGGPSAVTTRAVAAGVGSSVAAVDELFGGKSGLVRSLHAEGFARLAEVLVGLPASEDAERDIVDLALAFRGFVQRHRHLSEVMFSRPFAEMGPSADDDRDADSIYRCVLARVVAVLGPDRPRGAGKDAAIGLFATMRGLVELESAGILGSHAASIERRWRTTVVAVLRGWTGGVP